MPAPGETPASCWQDTLFSFQKLLLSKMIHFFIHLFILYLPIPTSSLEHQEGKGFVQILSGCVHIV